MGDLSQITFPLRETLTLSVPPHWRDHHFQGQPVLPAVEAMAVLARRFEDIGSGLPVRTMAQVRFAKFLPLDPALNPIQVQYEADLCDQGGIRTALVTKTRSKTGTISRTIEHAGMVFNPRAEPPRPWPVDLAATLSGPCTWVEPDIIYKELVPFGPGFRSICSPLALSDEGAMARVRAPELPDDPPDSLLGSPFPLDGAFHAACVWGQRHAGIVAFPVGIDQRTVFIPTQAHETYCAKILTVQGAGPVLRFDIEIRDHSGRLRETARGVAMRDVSHGRWRPPAWIARDTAAAPHDLWSGLCDAAVILERRHVAAFAHLALSPTESQRMTDMGTRRRNAYICARLACKRLWRSLSPAGDREAAALETVSVDRPHPVIPLVEGQQSYFCTVSHDDRFAVAAAGGAPIGVDVAKISSRAHHCRRIFMTPSEQALKAPHTISDLEAALRIWSVKEAASKALNMTLADAWEHIEVLALEEDCSRVKGPNGRRLTAHHAGYDGHLFTLMGGRGSNPEER